MKIIAIIKRNFSKILVLALSIFLVVQDNTGENQFYLKEQEKSPYGIGFIERHKESAKNFLAENIKQPQVRSGALTKKELKMAENAWRYFERNLNEETGLANSVDGISVTSMWNQASTISALYNAHSIGIIDDDTFFSHINNMLITLQRIPLVNNKVPHKFYDTSTKGMVLRNGVNGRVGYSAIDIGRLLIWLKIIKEKYTRFATSIDRIALSWDYCGLVDQGQLFGGSFDKVGNLNIYQEGRLGYEEYAAKGFFLWGFDTSLALKSLPVKKVQIDGFEVPVDARSFLNNKENRYVLQDSYLLDGLEFNWDNPDDFYSNAFVSSDIFSYKYAYNIYRAQQKRFEATGMPTAKTEFQLPSNPWVVYDTIYANGYSWSTINSIGKSIPNYAAFSTKAAFAMWSLWDTPYTDLIVKIAQPVLNDNIGYKEGVFEVGNNIESYTADTNSMVLSSLGHKSFGKAVKSNSNTGLWNFVLKSHIKRSTNNKCYPLKSVCTENCDKIDVFSKNSMSRVRLMEVESKLKKLESDRALQLKVFETIE